MAGFRGVAILYGSMLAALITFLLNVTLWDGQMLADRVQCNSWVLATLNCELTMTDQPDIIGPGVFSIHHDR